jgi:ubiquitin-like modifier-activating enzyme ATG7
VTGRSLDQQCTVTRPGLSFVAAGQAVELLVSLLQDGLLGSVPHQIRGNMSRFDCFCLTGEASEYCTACSPRIQSAFKENPINFLKQACDVPSQLERISGLAAMKEMSESIISLSLDEASEEEAEDGFEKL